MDQLIKMKMYTKVFSIIHCIRQQQKFSTKKLMGTSLEKTCIQKILKSALHQKEPQFNREFAILFFPLFHIQHFTYHFPFIVVLVPMLRSDPDPEQTLTMLKNELKTGLAKMNCLQLTEKYSEIIGNSKQAKEAKEA